MRCLPERMREQPNAKVFEMAAGTAEQHLSNLDFDLISSFLPSTTNRIRRQNEVHLLPGIAGHPRGRYVRPCTIARAKRHRESEHLRNWREWRNMAVMEDMYWTTTTGTNSTCLIVKVTIKTRNVTVEGPRGKLTKDLGHLAVAFSHPEKNKINIELHHGSRKNVATLRTVRTLINNLIIGVTKGFKYKMRYVYAHFPINVNLDKDNETGLWEVEIRSVGDVGGSDKSVGYTDIRVTGTSWARRLCARS